MMRIPFFLLLLGVLTTFVQADEPEKQDPATEVKAAEREEKDAATSSDVINFSLLDYRGKHHELRRADARVVVLYFTGFGCPIAQQSVLKIQEIQEKYKDRGVLVWMVNCMPQDDPDDSMVAFVAEMAARGQLASLIPESSPNGKEIAGRVKSLSKLSHIMPRSLVMGDINEFKHQVLQSRIGSLILLRDEHQIVTSHFGVKRTCEVIAIDTENSTIFYRGSLDDQMTPGAQKPEPTKHYLADALNEFLDGKPITTSKTKTEGCLIAFEAEIGDKPISYAEEVAPILQQKCANCHSTGNIGPFALPDYKAVKNWSAMIEETVLDRRMPPWDADPHYGQFANDRQLTPTEMRTILGWIKQGAPRGEGDDPLTKVPPPAEKWELGEPDFLVKLPQREEIPATGVLDYRYLNSEFEMPEDGWLRAAVCRPDNPKVVHHIIVRIIYPENYEDIPEEAYLFTTWAPGVPQAEFPTDTGIFVPKGAKFNFEMHYTTNGEAQTDQSEMGLYLAKAPPKMRLEVRTCETRDLDIPAGEADAEHAAYYCFKKDTLIYDIGPHMHVRGSWFKFQLLYPDGTREVLLSVPRYDFNWQSGHRLVEPKRVPAGTWVICTGGFDNSPRNPFNPNPAKRVNWGLQTWDEMFMGFLTVAEVPEAESAGPENPEPDAKTETAQAQ